MIKITFRANNHAISSDFDKIYVMFMIAVGTSITGRPYRNPMFMYPLRRETEHAGAKLRGTQQHAVVDFQHRWQAPSARSELIGEA